jgi:hypothetical protein
MNIYSSAFWARIWRGVAAERAPERAAVPTA